MATQLDELLESQRKYQQQVANAGQQYSDAVTAANNSYDKLMSDIDAQEKGAWEQARSNYQGNQRRAQMAHNAQLLGDLAHLGVQTWSTGALGGGGNGSNYVLPSIKPDDKYLQQGEAWRQKMNQTYLDEVAARTKRKREDALRGLERGQKAAADKLRLDYNAAKDAYTIADKGYERAMKEQEREDTNAYREADLEIKRQRAEDSGRAALIRANTAARNSGGGRGGKTAQQLSDDEVRIEYVKLPPEKRVKKLYTDSFGGKVWVEDQNPSLEAKRQAVAANRTSGRSLLPSGSTSNQNQGGSLLPK